MENKSTLHLEGSIIDLKSACLGTNDISSVYIAQQRCETLAGLQLTAYAIPRARSYCKDPDDDA